jgi:excisionase family DNA binding protein
MDRDPDALGIREAAAFVGAHEQTLRKLARSGVIPAYRIGANWRFRKAELVRWMNEQQRRPDGCSVLVVDDEEKICTALVGMLEGFGLRLRYALSGARGLELVAEEAPDLILLDLKMPDMNGPQFLEQLRTSHPGLPVVIVTAYPDSQLMQEASQYPPVMLLAKPVEKELLERTARSVLGERMARASTGDSQ